MIKDKLGTIRETLESYAIRARHLNRKLHFEPFPLNNEEDARNYLRLSAEYKGITEMFRQMCIFNWDKEDFLE